MIELCDSRQTFRNAIIGSIRQVKDVDSQSQALFVERVTFAFSQFNANSAEVADETMRSDFDRASASRQRIRQAES